MYSHPTIAIKYLQYWLTAQNGKGHGIHSPFVYQFVREVLKSSADHSSFASIEALRKQLLNDNTPLQVEDYGAGSATGLKKQRRVKDIAGTSLKSSKYARLLFRLVKFINGENIVELGTSLGITTAYLALASERASITSFEGASSVLKIARQNFQHLGLKNIQLIDGAFDQQLPGFIESLREAPDLIFVDGHHTYEATLRYFQWFLPKTDEYTVMVFDDIHWSEGMEKAWEEIRHHESVTLSIDLFFVGIIFFRKSQVIPQHFTIRF